MTEFNPPLPPQNNPPEKLIEQVKDVLEHLYDFAYLQRHPLAQGREGEAEQVSGGTAQHLRRELITAIDTLSPGPDVPFRAPHARPYNLLQLHYVEGLTVQEAANELGISVRQAYRDLRRGEESVAAILWGHQQKSSPQEPRAMQLSSFQAEMARLEIHPRPSDARLLLQQAQKAVASLAEQHAIHFQVETPPEAAVISTDPVMAHQVLVNILSQAVKQAQPGIVSLTVEMDHAAVLLSLNFVPKPEASGLAVVDAVVTHLIDRLGWKVEHEDQAEPLRRLALQVPAHGPTVLVVDDNEGLVELLGRYLTGHACRVTAAASGQEGLKLAQDMLPDAIILDVMMPEMDGWEFLQRLRARPETAPIPVVICSIFNDPELAYSLGASLYLPKPVSRDNVLKALRQLGVV
ncbi:MAG: response regulator [Anaerolineales bacterium]|nr:response regulator [Anaerolineales bacterium]